MKLYISSITNLADARFFSAYGVQYFGFCFDALDPAAITIDKAKEIVSWLHEPEIIGQFGNHQDSGEIQYVHAQLPLHAVQVNNDHPGKEIIQLPVWVVAENRIFDTQNQLEFISAVWDKHTLEQILSRKPAGIHISCSAAEIHGLSNVEYYAELMEILEPHLIQ